MRWLTDVNPHQLRVLVRLDLDLPYVDGIFEPSRLDDGIPTLVYLWEKQAAHVTVIGHLGHHVPPSDHAQFSLKPIESMLYDKLLQQRAFRNSSGPEVEKWLTVHENLRFDQREELNDPDFASELAKDHDLFVFDAFGTAHRAHTSIVGIPKMLPTVLGIQFAKEMAGLRLVTDAPERPVICILGGAKLETKLPLVRALARNMDVVLLGGKLAVEAKAKNLQLAKTIVADVTEDTLDITPEAAERFARFIQDAGTVVWNGPLGKCEDGVHDQGTRTVVQAIDDAEAVAVVGGGDTLGVLAQLGVETDRVFRHSSAGGGAMLHYLAYRQLPILTALANSPALRTGH